VSNRGSVTYPTILRLFSEIIIRLSRVMNSGRFMNWKSTFLFVRGKTVKSSKTLGGY
jgi:hypothetical protein